jgi:hypothetical protein
MGFCVIPATTSGDDAPLHIGEWADDVPRMQLFKVGHEALLVMPAGCFFIGLTH